MAVKPNLFVVRGSVDSANKLAIVVEKAKKLQISGFGDNMGIAASFKTDPMRERHKRAKNGQGR